MKKTTKILVTIFGGWFGLHKYIDGQIGMGLLYTFTGGIFSIGWIVDIVKAFLYKEPLPPIEYEEITELPIVSVDSLILNTNEICHYYGEATILKSRQMNIGTARKNSGTSFRIGRVTLHNGGGTTHTIRGTVQDKYPAKLYVTNQRIIAVASNGGFDKKIKNMSAFQKYIDGFGIQFGSENHIIQTREAGLVNQIILGVLHDMPVCKY